MRSLLDASLGERLTREGYLGDFDRNFWAIRECDFWKLERRQTFQEPGDDSWEAFSEGDWGTALRLIEERRDALRDYYQRITRSGFRTRRVRVVEEPPTPYLRWELRLLRLRHEYGGSVRVVGPDAIRPMETESPIPEVVTLGEDVMYEVLYNDDGILAGGVRYTDPSLVAECRSIIVALYESGADLSDYFDRNRETLDPSPCGG
ncbi:hypothetical protein IMZ11_37275 [Microtetraspora sp. AC03309]|uniref:DUF6879 family protein n=1 Tax=Microtetraspora sp. AC03309 TaxID=2779376 RepID=UPI001E518CDA|nr:DUF6879 family protein [Microtetraspora sp. AC03309]MCC5581271.1 hypothetical protein [Microtetraspora sp. AC03309]